MSKKGKYISETRHWLNASNHSFCSRMPSVRILILKDQLAFELLLLTDIYTTLSMIVLRISLYIETVVVLEECGWQGLYKNGKQRLQWPRNYGKKDNYKNNTKMDTQKKKT